MGVGMWYQVDFRLGPTGIGALFGRDWSNAAVRARLAAWTTKYKLPVTSEFFGYDDAGNPVDQLQPFRIGATPTAIRLTAIGPDACRSLADMAPVLHAVLIREAQAMLPMDTRTGDHELELRPFAMRYFLRNLVVGKTAKTGFWYRAADTVRDGGSWPEVAGKELAEVIASGLIRQAHFHLGQDDLSVSDNAMLGEDWIATADAKALGQALDIQFNSVGGHIFVPSSGKLGHRVALQAVEFTMRAHIQGVWSVGRLNSKDYGVILPASRAWATDAEAA